MFQWVGVGDLRGQRRAGQRVVEGAGERVEDVAVAARVEGSTQVDQARAGAQDLDRVLLRVGVEVAQRHTSGSPVRARSPSMNPASDAACRTRSPLKAPWPGSALSPVAGAALGLEVVGHHGEASPSATKVWAIGSRALDQTVLVDQADGAPDRLTASAGR